MGEDGADQKFNFEEFVKTVLATIPSLVKSSNRLPKDGDDYEFYRTFPAFENFAEYSKTQILTIMGIVLKNQGFKELFSQAGVTGQVDLDELTDNLISCNDGILERAMTTLEFLKEGKNDAKPMPLAESPVASTSRPAIVSSYNSYRLYHKPSITRPQSNFKEKVDNSSAPFIPKISVKPHSQKPLPEALKEINTKKNTIIDAPLAISNLIRSARQSKAVDPEIYEHPYQYELENFKPHEWQLEKAEPTLYKELQPLHPSQVVDNVESLQNVLNELKQVKEIAIDLEHHSYRSYLGITCLLQISTREKDYIVDPLALRDELKILNEVLADPNILKVLHGANQDIMWLQRDLGLYIVNMFDTGLAARALEIGCSLKFLLSRYCNLEVSKEHQLADWRLRPLDQELINYAQGDTHYLLYVYDVIKNELIEAGNGGRQILLSVLQSSKELCLRKFMKPVLTDDAHRELLFRYNRNPKKTRKRFNRHQFAALKKLYSWRDGVARREDESCGYVLPNHMLIQLAESLPRDSQGVLALCHPLPPLVRQHQLEIHGLILEAIENPDIIDTSLNEMDSLDQSNAVIETATTKKSSGDYADLMTCPHDLSTKKELPDLAEIKKRGKKRKLTSLLFESARDVLLTTSVNSDDQNEKLRKIHSDLWNPLQLFMPVKRDKGDLKKQIETESTVPDDRPPTLKEMLTGQFVWKIAKPKDKTVDLKPVPKTFGTVLNIDPSHKISTEQQTQLIDDLIRANRNKVQSPTQPQLPPQLEQHDSELGSFSKFRGGNRGGKKNFKRNRGRGGASKKPFSPHQYQKNDFRRFERKDHSHN